MSKTTMTVLYGILIALLVVVLIWGVTSARSGFGIFSGSFGDANMESAMHYEVDGASIDELRLALTSEDVRVEPTDGDLIVVDQTISGDVSERDKLRCGSQNGTLLIESGKAKSGGCIGTLLYSSVTIQIPRNRLLTADLSTLSGSVEVEKLDFRDCSVATASGYVDLIQVNAGKCDVETLSGDISVQGEYESLECEAASGAITAEAAADREVSLTTLSGDQNFEGACETFRSEAASGSLYAQLNGVTSIETDSMSGSVELECPDATRLQTVEANSASGSVTLALPPASSMVIDFDSMSGQLRTDDADGIQFGGAGSIEVNVETASGDLIIQTI